MALHAPSGSRIGGFGWACLPELEEARCHLVVSFRCKVVVALVLVFGRSGSVCTFEDNNLGAASTFGQGSNALGSQSLLAGMKWSRTVASMMER